MPYPEQAFIKNLLFLRKFLYEISQIEIKQCASK